MALSALLATSAGAASFDCKLARSKSEVLVCADSELSALDDELGKLFTRALQASPDRRAFRAASDKAWSRRESTCLDRACVLDWYRQRREQLTASLPAQAAEPVRLVASRTIEAPPQGPQPVPVPLPVLVPAPVPVPVSVAMPEPAAAKNPQQQLVGCMAPKVLDGAYSSKDGGRSVRSMLMACPTESQAWVQSCVSNGETRETCTYQVAVLAQDTLKLMKK